MALEQDLKKSIRAIDDAVKQQETSRIRNATLGMGGIAAALGALREFCKNWPKIRPALERIAELLKQNGQLKPERALRLVISFFDAIAKVCPLIP